MACIGQGSVLPDFYFPESTGNETKVPFEWDLFKNTTEQQIDALIHLGDQAYLDFVWSARTGLPRRTSRRGAFTTAGVSTCPARVCMRRGMTTNPQTTSNSIPGH